MNASVAAPSCLEVPVSLNHALDRDWLTRALAASSGGRRVVAVNVAEIICTMASKIRISVQFDGEAQRHHYCLKAFLDEAAHGKGGVTTLREAEFYRQIAPQLGMRTPRCAAVVTDHDAGLGIVIMEDLIAGGARFCSAPEPLTVEQAAQTLDQIARLHARSDLLQGRDWIPCRIEAIAQHPNLPIERLQSLMHDARSNGLPARTLDAALLLRGLRALAQRNATRPQTLLHGDGHPGNLYWTAQGPGFTDWQLIQHGNWALDVAYHIASVLPEDLAAREERRLLDHYRHSLAAHGGRAPDREHAWDDYRCAQIYGYYHWAITTRVEPAITRVAFQRLGAGVMRHDSYRLLGL